MHVSHEIEIFDIENCKKNDGWLVKATQIEFASKLH